MTKTCNKCLRELDEESFKERTMKNGTLYRIGSCNDCEREYRIERYNTNREKFLVEGRERKKKNKDKYALTTKKYSEAHKDKKRESNAKSYQKNKEKRKIADKIRYIKNRDKRAEYAKKHNSKNKDQIKAYKHEYYLKNKKRLAEKAKLYRETHKEEKYLQDKKYREQNKEKIREQKYLSVLVRRTKMKNAESSLIKEDWQKIIKFFDNKCAYCNDEPQKLTLDHFVPVSKGGGLTVNNSIPACKKCNQSKSDKDFFVWYPLYKHFDTERFKKVVKFLNYDLKTKSQQLKLVV